MIDTHDKTDSAVMQLSQITTQDSACKSPNVLTRTFLQKITESKARNSGRKKYSNRTNMEHVTHIRNFTSLYITGKVGDLMTIEERQRREYFNAKEFDLVK